MRAVLLVLTALLTAAPAAPAAPTAPPARCAPVELVVARGTTEPGRLGWVVGDLLARALKRELPNRVSAVPLDYPASADATSVGDGNRALVRLLRVQAARCPRQRFVLAGYSQGATAVQMALGADPDGPGPGRSLARIPVREVRRVAAVLLFGNPLRKHGWQDTGRVPTPRVLDVCADGDVFCAPGGTSFAAHVSYGVDTAAAARWAARLLAR